MSFPVALQSAVFYFLACTPCAKVRHRHKAKQKAKKEREEKARLEAEQPDLYRHPDPFNTNPYWGEEIMMGPSLPKKGKGGDGGSKNPSQQRLTSQGGESNARTAWSSSAVSTQEAGSEVNVPFRITTAQSEAQPPGSSHAVPAVEDAESARSPTAEMADDWNRKRYQREDEELWGHELARTGYKLMDAIKHAGSTAGKYVEARLGIEKPEKPVTEEDRSNFYITPTIRNPPVNDYHPPVVSSGPAHKDGHRWMLQPPPSAKLMEGKIPVSRSASQMSVNSRRTAASADGPALGRLVGERAVEAKIRNGEVPDDGEHLTVATPNRPTSKRTTPAGSTSKASGRNSPRSRSHSASTVSGDSSEETSQKKKKRRSRRIVVTPPEFGSEEEEDEYISRSLESLSLTNFAARPAPHNKSKLATVVGPDPSDSQDPAVPRGEKNTGAPRLREVANASLEPGRSNSFTGRPTGTSMDSGLELQT